ncbi:MAG: helix-hairpin-helix domain-containing protein, partial [Candidatus Thermoplasmatota archaeon]|nr:helix-hairpin-helix domain-containing protein [Candidatus Thermoplasmatota archaeon]
IAEQQRESDESEVFSQKEEPLESSVDFLPVESPEPAVETFSRRHDWDARRSQRKKEKEAKKLKKIELKKSKKKTRFSDQEAAQSFTEQPLLFEQVEETPVVTELIHSIEPAPVLVDYNVFSGIESIDEKTAEILYKNGYFSVENIKDATIDDLVSIRGIKRKLAKQIKREIEQKLITSEKTEFTPIKHKTTKKRGKEKHTDSTEWESESAREKNSAPTSPPACIYQGFILYRRTFKRHDKKNKTVHFFSKVKPDVGQPCQLPKGYQIAVNHKTGIPYLKKNRK